MKLPTSLKIAGVTAAALASSSLFAEIELTKEFSISGYVVGSAQYFKVSGEGDESYLDLDAYKLQGIAKFDKVSITGSLFAGSDADPVILDAFGTYDFGNGTTVTAGKFLSWLGYEAFDVPNLATITYANAWDRNSIWAAGYIPGYHTGIKVENSTETYSIGVAALDSLYGANFKGDGELDDGVAFEAYFTYKGIKDFTWFTGLGYDTGNASGDKSFVADTWIQYVAGKFTYAAEFCYGSTDYAGYDYGEGESYSGGNEDGYFALGFVKYQVDEKWAATFRLSAGETEDNFDFWKATFAPTYAVTKNLDIVAEYSYTDVDGDNAHELGLQARFKF